MGIKNIINKAGAKAADKVAKLSALSPEQLKQVEEQREKYLADQPTISDEELTNRLLASCGVEIFNSYLEQIKELYVPIENKIEFGTDFQESYNIRYFNITKWVVDKKENSLEKETINEFLKKYNLSKITRKNILSLYLKKLITKERIMEVFQVSKEKEWGEGAIYKALKENWNIQSKNTVRNTTVLSEDEARKKIRNRVNYYINVFETNNNFDEAKNNFIEELKQINGFEDLKSEYLGKFENYVNNKENIKKEESKNNIDLSIAKFLNLSKELQDDITKKAEILYEGSAETLNQLKRNTSNNFYLKFIWVEILKTINKEYPEIDIVGIRGGVR